MHNQSTNRTQALSIAVAGATGRVGRRLISLLAQDPVTILALTRQKSTTPSPKEWPLQSWILISHQLS